jgi:MFS family permease
LHPASLTVAAALSFANRPAYAWVVLAVGTLAVFCALGLARFGYSVILPSMQATLALDNAQAGALASANLTGYLALAVIGGALASHLGPRVVIAAGLAVTGAGMLLTGTADSFLSAAAWRALTGIGSGAANIAVMGMLAAWFSVRRRGLATGIVASGSSVALIVVGPLVPYLLALHGHAGWRNAWYIFGAFTLGIACLCYLLLRNKDEPHIAPAITNPGTSRPAETPHSLRQVYRAWPVWHLGLVYVAFGFAYIIFMTFFVKHLMASGGYSRSAAGSLFMSMGWASLIGGFLWGAVSDVIGRKNTLVALYSIHTVSFALFALASGQTGFTVAAILFGLCAFSIPAVMAAACGDVLGPKLAPAALGFITLFFGIGQALGPSVAGVIADFTGSFTPALLLASGVAFFGAIGAATLRPTLRSGG